MVVDPQPIYQIVMRSLSGLVLTAILATACHDDSDRVVLVHETPGEAEPCTEPTSWTAVILIDPTEVGCGIAFGEDPDQRRADALAQASDGDIDDYYVVETDEYDEPALSVVTLANRQPVGGIYALGAAGFATCDPADSREPSLAEALASCDGGCTIECELQVDDCHECCQSPRDCGARASVLSG